MGLQKESVFSKYFYPVTFAAMAGLSPALNNYVYKMPLHAGIHRHVALGIAGFMFGVYIDRYLERKWVHRDAVIKHYIELHPEDFVEEKRKYKEIFEEWYPAR